jgi:hypothetical protein
MLISQNLIPMFMLKLDINNKIVLCYMSYQKLIFMNMNQKLR